MKAISVKQPFAGFINAKIKTIETRTWEPKYRGDILICASKVSMRPKELDKTAREAFIKSKGCNFQNGIALCVARLVAIQPMIKIDETEACCEIYPGALSWKLKDIHPIKPFPVKGKLSLFEVDDNLIEYL